MPPRPEPSRAHERRDAAVGFLMLLLMMAGHAALETARDGLFLTTLPATRLPWAYLGMAVLAFAAAKLNQALLGRFSRRRLLAMTLTLGAATTLAFWKLSSLAASAGSLIAFYVWTGLFASVAVVQFWLLLGDVLDVGQAKRIFVVITAGGLLGAMLGSVLAGALLLVLPAQAILVAASVSYLLAAILPFGFSRASRRERPVRRSIDAPSSSVVTDPYRVRLVLLVLLGTLIVTGVDYTFKTVVSSAVPREELASFFARYYALVGAVALLVQLIVAPLLLRSLGASMALVAVPLLLLLGAGGFVLSGGLLAAVLLRTADGATRHSLARTTTEILYLPLGAARDRFKGFVEAVAQRGGQALASLAILAAVSFGVGVKPIGWTLVVLSATYLVCMVGLERHYLERFRHRLREGTIETRIDVPDLDLRSMEALVSALSSDDDAEVLAALELFAAYDKRRLVPLLILYHPSPAVVLRAFELFEDAARPEIKKLAGRLLSHPDAGVRAAALRQWISSGGDESVLRGLFSQVDPSVRATAAVGLIARGLLAGEPAEHALLQALESPAARQALAHSFRLLPEGHAWVAERLLDEREPAVASALARSLAKSPSEDQIGVLLRLLEDRNTRAWARDALVELGEPALTALERALSDASLPRSLRRHLPRSISRFASPRAAAILERALFEERDAAVEFKLLRGLGRLRAENPALPVDEQRMVELAQRWTREAISTLFWRRTLEVSERLPDRNAWRLLVELLSDRERSALERVFRLLHVLTPKDDLQMIFESLQGEDPTLRAASRELLEHLVPPEVKSGLLPLVADATDAQRLEAAAAFYDPPGRDVLDEVETAGAAAQAEGDEARLKKIARAADQLCERSLEAILADPSGSSEDPVHRESRELGPKRRAGLETRPRASTLRALARHAVSLLELPRPAEQPHAR